MILFYDYKTMKPIDKLHHQMFVWKVTATKFFVTAERLLSTDSFTKYHRYRTYWHINIWKATEDRTKPEEWGPYLKSNSLYPILCDLAQGQDYILNSILCSCKTNCANLHCGCKLSPVWLLIGCAKSTDVQKILNF